MKLHIELESLASDIGHGLRRLRRRPALTLLVIALFGLGIGLNVAWFSLADAVLLGPLPYQEPDRLYALWPARMFNKEMTDRADSELRSWQGVAAYTEWAFPVSRDGATSEQVSGALVSANFFRVLGVAPWRGADFAPDDARAASAVVIVSHAYWQQRLGGDDEAIGTTLTVDGLARRIVGVLPPGPHLLGRANDLWLPYPLDKAASDYQSSFYLNAIGRLRADANPVAATEELAAFSERLQAENPIYTPYEVIWPPTVAPLRSDLFGDSRGLLRVLAMAAGAVLLLVCANVSHLLLVHAESRRGEFALRVALGAGRLRLARSIVVETLLLAFAGGAVGCLVLVWTRGLLLHLMPENLPRRADLAVDGRALGVSMGLALLVTLLAALLPARRALALRGGSGLQGSRGVVDGMGRAQRHLITLEVAAVLTLVMTAVLLGRSLQELSRVDPGVSPRQAVTFRIHPPSEGRSDEQRQQLFATVVDRLRSLPEVTAAGGIQLLPLSGDGNWSFPYLAEGLPIPEGPLPTANFRVVTPGYAAAAGLPLLAGRDFEDFDGAESQPVGWINRTMAQELWPGRPAVGQVIQLFGNQPFTVVGVVADVHQLGLQRAPQPAMYRPVAQFPVTSLHLVVRTMHDPMPSVPTLRSIVAGVAPDVAVSDLRAFEDVVRRSVSTPRFIARLTSGFAGLAFFLGWCGILAVFAQVVQSRRTEIGVRLALGADGPRIQREVLRNALVLTFRGIVLGSLVALAVGWWLRSQLFHVVAWDPLALTLAVLGALTSVLLGTWWPAARAAQVDPAQALRGE